MSEIAGSATEPTAPKTGPDSPTEPPEPAAGVDPPGDDIEDGTDTAPSGAVDGDPNGSADTESNDSVHDGKLANEAAKWRREYRSAETRLTVASARIEEMQKAEINRLAATKLADPTDLWLAPGVDLGGLLGDDGLVDPERVEEATEAILEAKPHWRSRPRPVGAPANAVQGDGKPPEHVEEPTWATLLKGGNTAG